MMASAKWVLNDLSVRVFEYPEITIPEQELKKKTKWFTILLGSNKDKDNVCLSVNEALYITIQPHTRRCVCIFKCLATHNFFVCHAYYSIL